MVSGLHAAICATVASSINLQSLPPEVANEIPKVRNYGFAMVGNELLLVDPKARRVIDILTM